MNHKLTNHIEGALTALIDACLLPGTRDDEMSRTLEILHEARTRVRQERDKKLSESASMVDVIADYLSDYATIDIIAIPGVYEAVLSQVGKAAVEAYVKRYEEPLNDATDQHDYLRSELPVSETHGSRSAWYRPRNRRVYSATATPRRSSPG